MAFIDTPIIDAHQHLFSLPGIKRLMEKGREFGYQAVNVLTVPLDEKGYARNAVGMLMKATYPGQVYTFGGIQYHLPGAALERTNVREQVQELMQAGCDGIKMIEGKPTTRTNIPFPLDHAIYTDFYAFMEAKGYPILAHVADPPEFWDLDQCPEWAKKRGWFYDKTYAGFDALRDEMLNVLRRFPRLKVMLAHFFFLSTDLAHAHSVMEEYPNAILDLTPGLEQYPHFAKNVDGWREFFLKFQDRIVYGTDLVERDSDDDRRRMELIRRFLEKDEAFDYGRHKMHGIGLPLSVLEKIYRRNFQRIVGSEPRPLKRDLALAHCAQMVKHAMHIKEDETRRKILAELEAVTQQL